MKNLKWYICVNLFFLLGSCNQKDRIGEESLAKTAQDLYDKHGLSKLGVKITPSVQKDLGERPLPTKEEIEKAFIEMKKAIVENDAYNAENEKFKALMKIQKPKSAYELLMAMEKFPLVKAQTMQGMGGQAKWDEALAKMKIEGSKFTKSPF